MNARTASFLMMTGSVFLLAGWGFSLVGVDKLHQAVHASQKPVAITCAQLRSYRPGSNVHITLTQFVPYQEGILVSSAGKGHSQSFLVPILPADAPQSDPKNIVAVVYLSGVSEETALRRKLAEPRWTGVLHSRGELLKEMREINPGINAEQCWVMWEGSKPEKMAGAIPLVIGCPCLFVLATVFASLVALRPLTSAAPESLPTVAIQTFLFSAIGEALRWLQRRLTPAGAAGLLVIGGLAAVGGAGYLLHRDWDHVVSMTPEMMLAVTLGLIGLALLANALLLGYASWRSADTVAAPAPYQRVQVENIPTDARKWPGAMIFLGVLLLSVAGNHFYRSVVSLWTFVFAALGVLVLAGGAIWYGRLSGKMQQEKTNFWN